MAKKITGFKFLIGKKETTKPAKEKKKVKHLTVNQIDLFSNKLVYDAAFASKYSEIGESYENFTKRIADHLRDPAKVKEYAPYLKQLGFKS